jgi:hypothetical protein
MTCEGPQGRSKSPATGLQRKPFECYLQGIFRCYFFKIFLENLGLHLVKDKLVPVL